ncbi:Predicted membrane proteins, contain hemolysin III domain [Phaffia rhodozyma]|uniref:Predicted membrane proteins, contain hemolysin III domain n=1 Tax=Phaffia rhodozyma TaxID=264483 RepID=A0A0F7SL79_PHARH|nr:Predicted membrane proteins, contain hemolysin III domain [Phaffia rhodozyma]
MSKSKQHVAGDKDDLRRRTNGPLVPSPLSTSSSAASLSTTSSSSLATSDPQSGSVTPPEKNPDRLLEWDELEPWMKEFESEYILTGYRAEQNSYSGCAWSIVGYIHNETINIHTHLLGAVTVLPYLFDHLLLHEFRHPTLRWTDKFHFTIFLISAATCLGFSATYHTLSCHSRKISKRWNQFDYIGIVLLIVGSNFPAIYYGFYCDLLFQWVYISLITVLGSLAVYTVLNPTFTTGAYRWARTMVFLSLGLSAILPVSHNLYAYGLERAQREMGLKYLLGSGALYVVGALNYALRFPERKWLKTFDIVGSSHQIFHVCVIAAAWLHYK